MRIGLDFDNTIVCYERAIAQLVDELFELPEEVPRTKLGLRDHLRASSRESEWTAFQGELYGPGMRYAQPYKGAIITMQELLVAGHELVIISHRSRRPFSGPPHDLHAAARVWVEKHLQSNGLFIDDNLTINFLETREEKVSCISDLCCLAFLDDLPEVLQAPGFPAETVGILFDPSGARVAPPGCLLITAWPEIIEILPALAL